MELSKIYVYRIFHVDNLDYVLEKNKLTTYNHKDADPDYKAIGEGELIGLRADHEIVTVNSNTTYCPSCNYLPFYFAPRSVMLYRIQTGWKVKKVLPKDIVYAVYRLEDILEDIQYLFTDGHGYARMTSWYDDIDFLNELSWPIIQSKDWADTETDTDRQRKKQAEFWIKNKIPLASITGFAVYNAAAKEKVETLCAKHNRDIPVKVKPDYYY